MFDASELTLEDIRQHIITLRQQESEHRFIVGELMHYAVQMGETVGQLASDNNCTKSYIRQLMKTWKAFPTEESRLPFSDLSYVHFKLAAYAGEPVYWLEQAVDHAWSTKELRQAIKGIVVVDELREADRIVGKVERCLAQRDQAALYLYDHLSQLLREVNPDELYTGAEASEETKAGQAEEREAVEDS